MDRNEAFDALSASALSLHLAWASLDVMVEDVEDIQLLISGDEEDVSAMKIALAEGRLTVEQPTYGLSYKVNMARWMQLLLRIPRSWKGAVEATTISGPLTVRGLTGTDLILETATGSLRAAELDGITAALRTMTGALTAEQVQVEKLNLRTVSGDVSFDGSCTGDIHLSSMTGSTTLTLACPFQSLEGSTVSGNVLVNAPLSEANVSMRSVSGKLRTRGVSITDEGAPVSLGSVSGNLELINTL